MLRFKSAVLVVLLALVGATLPSAHAPAQELPAPLTEGLNFSVGLPPDPVSVRAGDTVQRQAQITNGSTQPADFDLDIISVDVADEGQVRPAEQRTDPIVENITVAPRVTVGAGTTETVVIDIRVSEALDPDIYFAGLLVQPSNVTPTNGGQITINRLLNVIAVDVTGEQTRGVEITFTQTGDLHVAGDLTGSYVIFNRNAGVSVSRRVAIDGVFSKERVLEDTGATSADGVTLASRDTVARGHRKTFDYAWAPGRFTLDLVRPTVSVTFSDAGNTRTMTEVGERTLVISPIVLTLMLLAFGGLIALVIVLRRRHRAKRAALPKEDKPAENDPAESAEQLEGDGNAETKDGSPTS